MKCFYNNYLIYILHYKLLLIFDQLINHQFNNSYIIQLVKQLNTTKYNMEKSPQPFLIKCSGDNLAFSACSEPKCSYTSLMCNLTECKCHDNHKKCVLVSLLSKLKTLFETKGSSHHPFLKTMCDNYKFQIKQLEIELQKIEKIIDQKQILLEGNQNMLYRLLSQGNSQQITSSLVSQVAASLVSPPSSHIFRLSQLASFYFSEYKKQAKKIFKQISDVIAAMHEEFKVPSTLKYTQFDSRVCPYYCTKRVFIGNHQVESWDTLSNTPALISPQLLTGVYNICRYKFKTKTTSASETMIGVCQLTQNLNQNYFDIQNDIQYGSFASLSQPIVKIGSAKGHRVQKSDLKFRKGDDQVMLEYNRKEKKVTVRNQSTGKEAVSYIVVKQHLPLYAGVILSRMKWIRVSLIDVQKIL